MGPNLRYAKNKPHIGNFVPPEDLPVCLFCGSDDLRVGGSQSETFLTCANCGADGPIGRGWTEAFNKYQVHEDTE